jgi:hypothetical protein
MSASDAAPLPRLGEVFFDVRGSSRSMRLSWYSNTGVAVFSIWQGGTCTGTFRLPIDDLPRMVDALQRGPRGAALPAADPRDSTGERQHRAFADPAASPAADFPDYATGQFGGFTSDEFPAPEPKDTSPGFQAGPYRDRGPGGPGDPYQSGYAAEPPPPAYPDASPYRDDPLGQGGHREERASGYRDTPPPAYGDDPLGLGSYRDDARPSYRDEPYRDRGPGGPGDPYQSGYAAEPPPPAYPDEPQGQRYADDPFQSVYPHDAPGPGYTDDPHPGSFPYGPPPGHEMREQRAPRGRS